MGADVMRWQYCAQPPDRNLLFGFGPAQEIQRKLLTLWNSATFLVRLRRHRGVPRRSTPTSSDGAPDAELQPLDRWLVERTRSSSPRPTDGYERWLTVDVTRAFEAFVDDLSNWYIRRSRRRFWDGDEAALRTLWSALVQALRVISPVMPFLTEHLWQALVADVVDGRAGLGLPRRLAGRRAPPDARLLAEVARACDASSSSATRHGRPPGSSCGSRCAGSSSRVRRSPPRTPTRSPTSSASRRSSSATSTPSCA